MRIDRFRANPPKSPDEATPIDPIWNRIHHALGAPDSAAIASLFDSEDIGTVGRERFTEILKVESPMLLHHSSCKVLIIVCCG